jgi:hypothetical protein
MLNSQSDSLDIKLQSEIDNQIWYPFIKAFNSNDSKLFNSIHSDNVKRITTRRIQFGKEYKFKNEQKFSKNKSLKIKRIIEFYLYERITTLNYSYEIGYYKIETIKPSSQGKSFYYGYFHVVLIKQNNKWKIDQDWDTNRINGAILNEDIFNKNKKGKLYKSDT